MKELRILLLVPSLLLCACSPCADSEESSGSKSEYSALQGIEYASRDKVVIKPAFASRGRYVLLVVPNERKDGNIWIMLRPEHPPFYKQMPRGSYKISPEILGIVVNRRLASTTVRESLASHVGE
jgi:hypothetical protein